MPTSEIHPLPQEVLKGLMEKKTLHCVSMYLPMHKSGKEQNLHLAQGMLKQCIAEAQKLLLLYKLKEEEVAKYLAPVKALLENTTLWRNPDEGLAVFLDKDNGLQYYKLPISFTRQTYVADHFYLSPVLPLYHDDGLFYILELSQDYVHLHEASRFGFKNLYIEDFAPDQLEKAVGFDYRPKMLQFRSGQDMVNGGAFHGHGEGKDDEKKELVTFFRALDKGVKSAISDQNAPLVLACTDYLADIYKQTSTYSNLYSVNISGDPEFTGKTRLHEAAWSVLRPYFQKTQRTKLAQFKEAVHTAKTSRIPDDIIKAAVNGKVDTLFVAEGTQLLGAYTANNQQVTITEQGAPDTISLINLAAMETYKQGGNVYFLAADDMPVKESPINALFRY